MEYLELLFEVVSQQSVGLIFCWRSFNREVSGPCYGQVETAPDYPFDTMKACVLETLSIQEKKNILFKFEPLGDRKPSQMLANMLAYCHSGMEQSIMFRHKFPQRLPVTSRTLEQAAGAW
jgi:hypothetical protein